MQHHVRASHTPRVQPEIVWARYVECDSCVTCRASADQRLPPVGQPEASIRRRLRRLFGLGPRPGALVSGAPVAGALVGVRAGCAADLAAQGADSVHLVGDLDQCAQVGQVFGCLPRLVEELRDALLGLTCAAIPREVALRILDRAQAWIEVDLLAVDAEFRRLGCDLDEVRKDQVASATQRLAVGLTSHQLVLQRRDSTRGGVRRTVERCQECLALGGQRVAARCEARALAGRVVRLDRGADRGDLLQTRACFLEVAQRIRRVVERTPLSVERDARRPLVRVGQGDKRARGVRQLRPAHQIIVRFNLESARRAEDDLAGSPRGKAGNALGQPLIEWSTGVDRQAFRGDVFGHQAVLRRRRRVRQVRQDGSAGVATGRRASRGIEDHAVTVHQQKIAAPSHRFYNEQHPVRPVGGVPLLALELEHALQTRLANRSHPRMAKVLTHHQVEWALMFDASGRQLFDSLHTPVLEVRRQQHVGPTDSRREELDGEAELVDEHDFLKARAAQPRSELIAHRGECQRVKSHTA